MPKSTKQAKSVTPAKAVQNYVPTPAESKAAGELLERVQRAKPHANAKVTKDGGRTLLSWDHPVQELGTALWANALGTSDLVFAGTILEQLAQVSRTGTDLKEAELNASLSLVRNLAPTDPLESLLIAQMVTIHNAIMVAARRLNFVERIEQQDSASAMLNKLARTFTMQVDALKRYRQKGEQLITVQHVNVSHGGQAIIGNVQHAPGGALKKEVQSHELASPDAPGPALLGNLEANKAALPSASSPRQARVPIPRRAGGSAEGSGERKLSQRQSHG